MVVVGATLRVRAVEPSSQSHAMPTEAVSVRFCPAQTGLAEAVMLACAGARLTATVSRVEQLLLLPCTSTV